VQVCYQQGKVLSIKRNIGLTIAALIGSLLGSAFLLMVYFMALMTGDMHVMTGYIAGMSKDISGMHDHFSIMVSEVSKIDDVVAHMDDNINAMNNEITLIENSISTDLRQMTYSVSGIKESLQFLDAKVGSISLDVNRMSGTIDGISYNIYKGSQSFSSPPGYMMNMMP
jgi:methyl-accepting chemotaxis protein